MTASIDTLRKCVDTGYAAISNVDCEPDAQIRASLYRKLALEAVYALSIAAEIVNDYSVTQTELMGKINASPE